MWAAAMPPSSMPPKPGAGSTGRSRRPSATRRVGAMGRELVDLQLRERHPLTLPGETVAEIISWSGCEVRQAEQHLR